LRKIDLTSAFDFVFIRTWWTWDPGDRQWFSMIYHWFNLLEGVIWLIFAGLVLRRWLKHRNSRIEIVYAMAFFTFAATDVREAWEQSSWLIWLKLFNLLFLFWLRRIVMRRWYPTEKLY
jgi:hypothetical protein